MLSMSALLRCWFASVAETPSPNGSGLSAAAMAQNIDQQGVQNLTAFLSVAHSAWGRDPEYYRLWANLNLTLCLWLWNRLVIDRDRAGTRRYITLTIPEFKSCLMALSADGDYLTWLIGRNLSDRDRSPCFARIKSIFVRRLLDDNSVQRPSFPKPAWAS